MTSTAAGLAAGLFGAIAAFQVALAAGAPWGEIAWGGANQGQLPTNLRLGSAAAAVVLLFGAAVVLAQGGVVSWSPLPENLLGPATWALAGLMVLNTAGNMASESRFETFVFGPITLVLAVLCIIVVRSGTGPS